MSNLGDMRGGWRGIRAFTFCSCFFGITDVGWELSFTATELSYISFLWILWEYKNYRIRVYESTDSE